MLDDAILAVARAAKGFMPDDEGAALHDAALDATRRTGAPLLEVGTYCGKSAVYLGAAARDAGTVLFTVDHHRGSEENQSGWEHHDREVVDARTGRMDTLPFFRRTIEAAGLEAHVVGVVGHSGPIAAAWATPLAFLFIDGGHSEAIAMGDYAGWTPHLRAGGILAIHDVFERSEDGGQGPFHVWQRAVADGFEPRATTGSLRTLTAP
jgi:predicted O-methyltransferase YrrM